MIFIRSDFLAFSKNCILFLWCTDPLLNQQIEVIDAWGFIYKTVGFYWAKQTKNKTFHRSCIGYWTRSNPEICLLATKGKPKRVGTKVDKLVSVGTASQVPKMVVSVIGKTNQCITFINLATISIILLFHS